MFANVISYNAETGHVVFDPGPVVLPMVTGIIGAVSSGLALFVLFLGLRWVLATLRASDGGGYAPDAWDKRQAHEGRWDRGGMYQFEASSPTGSAMAGPKGDLP